MSGLSPYGIVARNGGDIVQRSHEPDLPARCEPKAFRVLRQRLLRLQLPGGPLQLIQLQFDALAAGGHVR